MRNSGNIFKTLTLSAAIGIGATLSAQATVDLTLTDASSRAMSGFVANIPLTPDLNANELIGIYKFTASGGFNGGTLWSTCLSPAGVLDYNTHNYTVDSYSQGAPGHNPAAWATGVQGDAGIQNAQYLWRLYSPTIIASGNAAQGSGLVMAMYEALYDSTEYGVDAAGSFSSGAFSVSTWAGGTGAGTAYAWANTYLGALNPAAVTANTGSGSILRDTLYVTSNGAQSTPGAGQDFIYNLTPVPEPTTMIAGALLLLPFGASTIRFMRKNSAA